MHYEWLAKVTKQGASFWVFNDFDEDQLETFGGYFGRDFHRPFIQGKALIALEEWHRLSSDSLSKEMGSLLSNYLRDYGNGQIWKTPVPTRFPAVAGGQAVGLTHGFLTGIMGLLEEAETLKSSGVAADQARV